MTEEEKLEIEEARAAYKEYLASFKPSEEEEMSPQEMALRGLDYLGRGLDYAGGVARTALAAPFMESVSAKDVLSALKARPLSGDEILKRGGVEQGESASSLPLFRNLYSETGAGLALQKGGMFDPSGRGLAGFVLETLTDPSLGLGNLAKAAKYSRMALGRKPGVALRAADAALRPIATATEKVGKTIYGQGLRNLDRETELLNRANVSDVLFARGQKGGVRQTKKNIQALREEAGRELEKIRGSIPGTVSIQAPIENLDVAAQHLKAKGIPELERAGQNLEDLATGVITKQGENLAPLKASELYTDLGQNINFQDPTRSIENLKRLEFQQGVKSVLDDAVEKTGQLERYQDMNRLYSSAKTVDKAALKDIKRELGKMGFTQMDAAALATMTRDPVLGAALYGGKNLARILGSHGGSTYTGQALKGLAPSLEAVTKRPSVWKSLKEKEEEK